MNFVKLGRELCYLLRHNPKSKDLYMDGHGWVKISELLEKVPEFTQDILEKLVSEDKKQRFSISDDGKYIRANQGHSISVDLDLEVAVPPDILYHGTVEKFISSIYADGLQKQQRHHVHLSADIDTAIQVGSRRGVPIILLVDAKRMVNDGYVFYRSVNGVWLTDTVPANYITLMNEKGEE